MNKADEYAIRVSKALISARAHAGISQDKLASRMGLSRPTIAAWERGAKMPPSPMILKWFMCCGVSATRYVDACIHPGLLEHLEDDLGDAEKRKILHEALDEASMYEIDALIYLRYGDHGSDHLAVLTEMLANLHCPLAARVSHCGAIIDDYEMAQAKGTDSDPNATPQPIMALLRQAYNCGKVAAMADQAAYSITREGAEDAKKEKGSTR